MEQNVPNFLLAGTNQVFLEKFLLKFMHTIEPQPGLFNSAPKRVVWALGSRMYFKCKIMRTTWPKFLENRCFLELYNRGLPMSDVIVTNADWFKCSTNIMRDL